jgi:hypothetical protein
MQAAEKIETYKTKFLVTDAAYFEEKLYLIGHTKTASVYLQVFNQSENETFFTKKPKKYYLGSTFSLGQIEGIAINRDGVFISGEVFYSPLGVIKNHLYFYPFSVLCFIF